MTTQQNPDEHGIRILNVISMQYLQVPSDEREKPLIICSIQDLETGAVYHGVPIENLIKGSTSTTSLDNQSSHTILVSNDQLNNNLLQNPEEEPLSDDNDESESDDEPPPLIPRGINDDSDTDNESSSAAQNL